MGARCGACSRLLPVAVALTTFVAPTIPAFACGSLPDVEITIIGSSPTDGASDVPPDAPLIFDVHCKLDETWTPLVSDVACRDFGDQLELELRADGAIAPTTGRSGTVQGKLMFKPDAPLRPDTLYRASARVRSLPRDVRSEPTPLSFRTGSGSLPALVSATPPSISLEWYDAPYLRCDEGELEGDAARDALTPQICPVHFESNCKEAGTRRRLRYRVQTGILSGGDTRLPYTLEAILTDVSQGKFNSPSRVNAPSEGNDPAEHTMWSQRETQVKDGERGELYFDAPSGAADPEQLCVRMRVLDAAGNVLAPPGRCDSRAQRLAEVGTDPEGDTGCSMRARGTSANGASLLIAAVALALRRRRARREDVR